MPPTTRRTFVTALAGAPLLAAGAFTLNAQEKLKLCCTPIAPLPPMAEHMLSELTASYYDVVNDDGQTAAPLRRFDSAQRLAIAFSKQEKSDQLFMKTLRGKNRDQVVADYLASGQAKLGARILEAIPDYVPPAGLVIYPDVLDGERGYDILAKGEYTKFQAKLNGYVKFMIKARENTIKQRGPLVRVASRERCIPDWCDELQMDINTGAALGGIVCAVCNFGVFPACVECVAIGVLMAVLLFRQNQSCIIRMQDPESCW